MSDGKRKLSDWYVPAELAGMFVLPFIALIGILAAMFLPLLNQARRRGDATLVYVALLFGIVGIMLLFFARLPLYRQRRFFTFGSRALDDRHKRLYRWAYRLIGVCAFLLVALILTLR
jgi:bacteriorhodopsin